MLHREEREGFTAALKKTGYKVPENAENYEYAIARSAGITKYPVGTRRSLARVEFATGKRHPYPYGHDVAMTKNGGSSSLT
jgi:hypothetical protein